MEEEACSGNQVFLNKLLQKIKCKHEVEKLKSEELESIRRRWYIAKIVHTAAHEICAEQGYIAADDLSDGAAIASLSNQLALAECAELIEDRAGLIGVQPSDISEHSKKPSKEYKKMVQLQIHRKLLGISQFYLPSSVGSGSNFCNAKALQLHHVVTKDRETTETNRQGIELLGQKRLLLLQELHKIHSKNIYLFEILLRNHSLKTMPEHATKATEHITAKTEALTAKIRLFEKQICADTYTASAVKELSMIRSHLDDKLTATRKSLSAAENKYVKCLSAGTEFQIMAKEYAGLKEDIKARMWALNELKAVKQHKT